MADTSFYGAEFNIMPADIAVFEKAIGGSWVSYAADRGWKIEEGDPSQGVWFGECQEYAWEEAVDFLKKIGPHLTGPHTFDWQDSDGNEGRVVIDGNSHEFRTFDKVTVDWKDPEHMKSLLQTFARSLAEKLGADAVRTAVDEAIVAPVMEA